jgi:hypothetical protein
MAKSLSSQMKKLKSQQVEQLQAQARENTTISRGNKRDGMNVVTAGRPLDHEVKQTPAKSKNNLYVGQTFGMSKGCTLNMENYESMRVDCWLSDVVREGETVQEAFARVESIIDTVLEESALTMRGE